MSNDLRTTIEHLASQFVAGVLAAMRKAPLEDILDQSGGRRVSAARPAASAPAAGKAKRGKGGRLARRSPGELAKVLDEIVALLQKNPEGLRAEQIRDQLSLISKELPRPLADGISSGRLRKKGEKRATTYFATGRGGSAAPKKAAGGRKKAAKK